MTNNPFLLRTAIFLTGLGLILFFITLSTPDRPGQNSLKPNLPTGFRASMMEDPAQPGADLFVKTCTQCHDLPNPKIHAATEWPPIITQMLGRLQKRKMMSVSTHPLFVPNDQQVGQLVTYLKDHAMKEATRSGNETSSEFILYESKCTQCHALPHPTTHTRLEWPTVIDRMREHIKERQKNSITDEEKSLILNFLAEHS